MKEKNDDKKYTEIVANIMVFIFFIIGIIISYFVAKGIYYINFIN